MKVPSMTKQDAVNRAIELAGLFGGNGLSQNQQVELASARLLEWNAQDMKESTQYIFNLTKALNHVRDIRRIKHEL